MMFDPIYLLFALPGLLLGLFAQFLTRSRFNHYSRVAASSGLTGAQAAYQMLRAEGLHHVGIERVGGFLSDHYDPRRRVLRLSPEVYDGRSLAAVGVACHEAGHAIQHAKAYAPLALRTALVPAATITSHLSGYILWAGLVLSFASPLGRPLLFTGILLLSVSVLFTLITLPVEWDASARAKRVLVADGIVAPYQEHDAGAVLDAAFLTYLAAAVSAVMTLLYYVWRFSMTDRR